jgi:hypothetical protein
LGNFFGTVLLSLSMSASAIVKWTFKLLRWV